MLPNRAYVLSCEFLGAPPMAGGLKRDPLPTVRGKKKKKARLVVATSNESNSTRGVPLPLPLASGRGTPYHPPVPPTSFLDDFMAQAKVDLELVIKAEVALSSNVPPRVAQ